MFAGKAEKTFETEKLLKRKIFKKEKIGAERIVFGSNYPICSLGAFVGSVVYNPFLTVDEKERILSLNAKKTITNYINLAPQDIRKSPKRF